MRVVRLYDYTEYESRRCNYGGCYGFCTEYCELPNGEYETYYKTTSGFDYCDKCGGWHNSSNCKQDREIVTSLELERILKNFKKDMLKNKFLDYSDITEVENE